MMCHCAARPKQQPILVFSTHTFVMLKKVQEGKPRAVYLVGATTQSQAAAGFSYSITCKN
eukprot:scaffold290987_cov13-Tisochrysis_lutea.AAC.1